MDGSVRLIGLELPPLPRCLIHRPAFQFDIALRWSWAGWVHAEHDLCNLVMVMA